MMSTIKNSGPLLTTVLAATFIGQFDFFIVNVAAPAIQTDLAATSAQLELVVSAYAFTYAAGLVTGGRLGDILGRRNVFAAGLVLFAATSALCAAAASAPALIAFRALQGLSAAVLLPQVLAFINTVVPAQVRPRALGWFGVASGLGSLAGQGLGGLLVAADVWGLGWRIIFVANIPAMLAALLATFRFLPSVRPDNDAGLDLGGAAVFFIAMAGLMAAPLLAQSGHPVAAAVTAAAGLVILGAGLAWQRARVHDRKPVLLDPAVFTIRSMRWGSAASAAFMVYFASFMFVLAVVLQRHSGLTPAAAGLVFVPSGVTFMLSSLIGSRWVQRHIRTGLVTGCALTAAGLAIVVAASLADVPAQILPWWFVVAVSLTGLGNGLVLPTLNGLSLSQIDAARSGMASGVVTTLQQFGASLGVAAVGALFFRVADAASLPAAMAAAAAAHFVLLAVVALACVLATRRR